MGLNFTIDMTRGLGLGLGSSTILKVRFFGTPCVEAPFHRNCHALFFLSFRNDPEDLFYFQAFFDQGTANSGCNGDATLRSIFNFWKDQATTNQVVRWSGVWVNKSLRKKTKKKRTWCDLFVFFLLRDNLQDSCARVKLWLKGLQDMIVAGLKEKVKALQP